MNTAGNGRKHDKENRKDFLSRFVRRWKAWFCCTCESRIVVRSPKPGHQEFYTWWKGPVLFAPKLRPNCASYQSQLNKSSVCSLSQNCIILGLFRTKVPFAFANAVYSVRLCVLQFPFRCHWTNLGQTVAVNVQWNTGPIGPIDVQSSKLIVNLA